MLPACSESIRILSVAVATLVLLAWYGELPADSKGRPRLPTGHIKVEVTTHLGDRQVFYDGDEISFLVSLERDAFLLVIYEDAGKNLIQLIPNKHIRRGYYRHGLFFPIPDDKTPFRFTVQRPYGQERLWVFAASRKFPALPGKPLGNGLLQLNQPLQEVLAIIRRHGRKGGTRFGEAQTSLRTLPRH